MLFGPLPQGPQAIQYVIVKIYELDDAKRFKGRSHVFGPLSKARIFNKRGDAQRNVNPGKTEVKTVYISLA